MTHENTPYEPEADILVSSGFHLTTHINTPHRQNAEIWMLKQAVASMQQPPWFKRAKA